jgi:hypothetical protein
MAIQPEVFTMRRTIYIVRKGAELAPWANICNDQLCIDLDRNTGLFRQADKIGDGTL